MIVRASHHRFLCSHLNPGQSEVGLTPLLASLVTDLAGVRITKKFQFLNFTQFNPT